MIYKSRYVAELDWDIVRSICESSEKSNALYGVTGVLLASRTHFLQVLEGNFNELNMVFRRIARDQRHTDLTIIGFCAVESRLFGGWGMRGIGAFDFNKTIETELQEKYGEEEGGIRFPVEEWRVLAMLNDIKMIGANPGK